MINIPPAPLKTRNSHAFETSKLQRPQDNAYQAILTANKERPLHESMQIVHSQQLYPLTVWCRKSEFV